MNSDVYRYVAFGSLAGALAGALVMWNRKRAQTAGESRLRRIAVLTAGTAAFAGALVAFGKAFGAQSVVFASTAMIASTGWAAVVNSVTPLPLPRFVREVGAGEFAILRLPWTGVRLFGALLRNTPLRHLGGRVYLSEAGRDPKVVAAGILDAQRVHLWALLFSCPWLIVWGLEGRWMALGAGLAVHVPLNLFPFLHLRLATWRLEKCVPRIRRDSDAKEAGGGPRR